MESNMTFKEGNESNESSKGQKKEEISKKVKNFFKKKA